MAGVALTVIGPYLTSRSLTQANERREVAVRADNERQKVRELEENASVRAHEDARREVEAKAALTESWRERRTVAHRSALEAINNALDEIGAYGAGWDRPYLDTPPALPDEQRFAAVNKAAAEVELYCSATSSEAFARLRLLLTTYHLETKNLHLLRSADAPTFPRLSSGDDGRSPQRVELNQELAIYRSEARSDLGTLN